MGMGMEQKNERSYAVRVDRLLEALNDLEECAFEFPETRDKTVELLERYSESSKGSERVLKRAADEVAAVGMLEILHDGK